MLVSLIFSSVRR